MSVRSPLRRWTRRLLILAFSLLVVVAGVEAWVRIADPWGVSQFKDSLRYFDTLIALQPTVRLFAHKPHAEMRCHDFTIHTNNLGFRGPDATLAKPPGTTRLLFLGDSVTFGWGVDDAATFVRRAETELTRLNPGRRFECVNAGHMQFDTVQEAAVFDDVIAQGMAPDAVYLVFVYNDVTLTSEVLAALFAAQQKDAADPPGLLQRTWVRLAGGPLRGIDSLRRFLTHVVAGEMEDQIQAEIRKAMSGEAPGWKACQDALRRIDAKCRELNIPFCVLDHAGPEQVPQLARFCADAGITCRPLWLTPAEQARPIRHSASDVHCNALGHDILLGKLRPVLRELGLRTE